MNRCTRIGAHDGQPITVCKGEDAQTIIIIKDVHVSTRRGRTKKRGEKKEGKEEKRGEKEEKRGGGRKGWIVQLRRATAEVRRLVGRVGSGKGWLGLVGVGLRVGWVGWTVS